MTVIGVLLIVVAAVLLLIGLLAGADTSTTLSLGGIDISMSAMGIFLMGAATVLIFVSGLEMLRSGLRRSLSRRRELKEARAVVAEQERRDRDAGVEPAAAGTTAPGTTATGETAGPAATGTGEPPPTTTTPTTPGTTGSTPAGGAPPPGTTGTGGTGGTTGTGGRTDDPGRHLP